MGRDAYCQRVKNAKSTLEQIIVRYTKNYLVEKSYFENIKSRKFLNLIEEGSLGKIWLELKDYIGVIEVNSKNLMTKFKEYVDSTTKDLKEYEQMTKQLETEYTTIKKRKDLAMQEINKKREKYVVVFKEWDDLDGQATQARLDLGASNPKTQKLVKLATDKFQQKETAEFQYIDSVKAAQGFEKDYDTKLAELLRRFEMFELQRLMLIQQRLQEFFSIWHENTVKYAEVLNKCVIAVSNITPREDLVSYSNTNQTDTPHMPYQLATLCQRTHGADIPSANHALPYVAGSPTAASTSQPLIVTRGQEMRNSPAKSQPANSPQPPRSQQTQPMQQQKQSGYTAGAGLSSGGGGFVGGGSGGGSSQKFQQQQSQTAKAESGSIVVATNEFVVAKVLVAYQATTETEANVAVGETVMVIPDKTGQGWVYCLKHDGQGGYVPTDYVKIGA